MRIARGTHVGVACADSTGLSNKVGVCPTTRTRVSAHGRVDDATNASECEMTCLSDAYPLAFPHAQTELVSFKYLGSVKH